MFGKILKIALGDLRHSTIGRHSVYVPVGIGYISSYTLSQFEPGSIEIRLYTEIGEFVGDIEKWGPDIVGLSNYCWNSSVSHLVCKYAKQLLPKVLCIMGGPEFPKVDIARKNYLMERPEVDTYIYGDGEVAFANIVEIFCKNGMNIDKLKSQAINGAASIDPESGELIVGNLIRRFKNLDVIPSPYLSGLLDKWLLSNYMPGIETTRGCPFQCAFCRTATDKMFSTFSTGRIFDELSYIVKTVTNPEKKGLCIFDSNFGMYSRDLEISDYLGDLMDKYNWPMKIEASTGKQNIERILECVDRTKNRLSVSLSRQSMNSETCKIIKRKNFPIEKYLEIVNELEKRGQSSFCELIIPMPGETKESYFAGQKILIEAGINSGTYTTMMLKGTLLASKEYREKYGIETKFRVLPRQFGEYKGNKCFEVEEVCVATNTMSFEDYLDCRSFSLLSLLFTKKQFDIIHRHVDDLGLSFYEYIYNAWTTIKHEGNCLTEIYNRFTAEVREELFDTRKDVYDYFSKQEKYDSLLKAEKGDNLLRKYLVKILFTDWNQLINFVYGILEKTYKKKFSQSVPECLDAAKRWTIAMRDVTSVFYDEKVIDKVETLNLPFDVFAWYKNEPTKSVKPISVKVNHKNINESAGPEEIETKVKRQHLSDYNTPVIYKICYDKEHIESYIGQCKILWGKDSIEFLFGRMLSRGWNIDNLWRVCHPLSIE